MKNINQVFLLFLVSICFGLSGVVPSTTPASASNAGGLPACKATLDVCTTNLATCNGNLSMCNNSLDTCNTNESACQTDLTTCNTELTACQASISTFPGDGYTNPDKFGASGHGPALSYTDNGDGTFTDNVTNFMWEEKTNVSGSVHNVNNLYEWSLTPPFQTQANGTLFTVFLNTLNNKCSDETTTCTSDTDCNGIGNGKCGFAGHRDWCIPNLKTLLSIVDFSKSNPASSTPGLTAIIYWSATTVADIHSSAWAVIFIRSLGNIATPSKDTLSSARAVRPCE